MSDTTYVIIYWDEGDDIHLVKNSYHETEIFESYIDAAQACNASTLATQIVRLNP